MIVCDATVVIALARMHRLEVLKQLYQEAWFGPVVKGEVVDRGKEVGAPEVGIIERGLADGWLRVVKPTRRESTLARRILATSRLDPGEAESIAIARSRGLVLAADDKEARLVGASLGVDLVGTAGILLEANVRGLMDYQELEQAVGELARITWLSADVVTNILRRAREVRR